MNSPSGVFFSSLWLIRFLKMEQSMDSFVVIKIP